MSDFCITCLTEAVDTEDWFYCEKTTEYICPWCKNDLIKIHSNLNDE